MAGRSHNQPDDVLVGQVLHGPNAALGGQLLSAGYRITKDKSEWRALLGTIAKEMHRMTF